MTSLVLVEMTRSGSLILLMLEVTLVVESLVLLSKPSVLLLEILLVLVGSLARWRILLIRLIILRALSLGLGLDQVSRNHEWIGIVGKTSQLSSK